MTLENIFFCLGKNNASFPGTCGTLDVENNIVEA
jgi:hypothetical protein